MLFKDHFQTQLNNKIKECNDCDLKNNPGPVLGYGNIDADIMFISDVPGIKETQTGVPFTGKAKEMIVNTIKDTELKKDEYYFTYLVKHSLNGKKKMDIVACRKCLNHLLEEIELVNPRVICSMGFYITEVLTKHYKMKERIKSLKSIHGNGYIIPAIIKRKKVIRPKRYLIPTWNPAVDNSIMNIQFKEDVLTIKTVDKLKTLLFN